MRTAKPLAVAIAVTLLGTGASAQGVLEEVIVTATKRAESLQDIPVTVNAFSAETIQEAGINNAGDLAIMTPALAIAVNTSPFAARMTIRGIGTAQTDPALEPGSELEPSRGAHLDRHGALRNDRRGGQHRDGSRLRVPRGRGSRRRAGADRRLDTRLHPSRRDLRSLLRMRKGC